MPHHSWTLSQKTEFEGREIRFDVSGDGPPLVAIHGTPWSSYNLRHIIQGLSARYRVYYFDLLGYGQSDRRAGDVSLAIQNRLFDFLLEYWGLDKPIVVGHDFGGATALRTRLIDGRLYARLILIDPVAVSPWGSEFFRHVAKHESVFAGMPAFIHEAVCRSYIESAAYLPLSASTLDATLRPWIGDPGQGAFYRQIAQANPHHTAEIEPRYATIQEPTLIIWGQEDAWIPVDRGRSLSNMLPHCTFRTIPDAGHLVIEEAPGAVIREIVAFLDS